MAAGGSTLPTRALGIDSNSTSTRGRTDTTSRSARATSSTTSDFTRPTWKAGFGAPGGPAPRWSTTSWTARAGSCMSRILTGSVLRRSALLGLGARIDGRRRSFAADLRRPRGLRGDVRGVPADEAPPITPRSSGAGPHPRHTPSVRFVYGAGVVRTHVRELAAAAGRSAPGGRPPGLPGVSDRGLAPLTGTLPRGGSGFIGVMVTEPSVGDSRVSGGPGAARESLSGSRRSRNRR